MIWMLLGCGSVFEPLDLPSDPAVRGTPVGVRTVELADATIEVFYPAPESAGEQDPELTTYDEFLPVAVLDLLGPIELTAQQFDLVRDAELRVAEIPYPVVVFSHGFGGFRTQSSDLTAHLASRGYVVLSADHPGRRLEDLLPCVFSPPLEGCDLTGSFEDGASEQIEAALDWLQDSVAEEEGWLFEGVDTNTVGLLGHSAGAKTVLELAEDPRFAAVIGLSGAQAPSREVPTAVFAGSCDGVITAAESEAAAQELLDGAYVEVIGGGHHAFSDICGLELGILAREVLVGREDVNETLLDGLMALAEDGCAEGTPTVESCEVFGDLPDAQEAVRGATTVFFDRALRDAGAGLEEGSMGSAEITLLP